MAYDPDLTERFRAALGSRIPYDEKRMMGEVCFLWNGHMIGTCGRGKSGRRRFLFRVGKAAMAEALERPGAAPMVHGGRTMGGFVSVDEAACDPSALTGWLDLALAFVETLPPK
ncbi:MAG: TfoX/Sxy family protein [Alphaproteobacteria bacterium]|nr:TfoX/Sxy family protein [Alphaproteobacteria bacterium]MCB9930808.1 TfoX/Sxy family protein [Alphaproteobacteria bacterium]